MSTSTPTQDLEPTQESKKKAKQTRNKKPELTEEQQEAKTQAFQLQVDKYRLQNWKQEQVETHYKENIQNIKNAQKAMGKARWNLAALRNAYTEEFTKIKENKKKEPLGKGGEKSRMAADINLLSKMPSYLRPFKN